MDGNAKFKNASSRAIIGNAACVETKIMLVLFGLLVITELVTCAPCGLNLGCVRGWKGRMKGGPTQLALCELDHRQDIW